MSASLWSKLSLRTSVESACTLTWTAPGEYCDALYSEASHRIQDQESEGQTCQQTSLKAHSAFALFVLLPKIENALLKLDGVINRSYATTYSNRNNWTAADHTARHPS
jgi:hypothetical protein